MILFSINVNSQLRGLKYDDKLLFQGMSGINLSLYSQSWNITDFGKISQTSVPINLTIPITNRIIFSVINSPVITTRKSDATPLREAVDEKIQNLSDTRLSLSYVLPGDKTWINSNFSLPTGLTKLNPTQFEIARVISQSGFNFRVPVFGQGTNGTIGVTNARVVNRRLTFGYGVSLGYKSKFSPYVVTKETLKTESIYDPGEDISANFGADYTSQSKKIKYSGDVTITETIADKFNGKNSFKSGTRLNLFLVYQFKEDEIIHFAQIRARIKSKNKIFTDSITLSQKSSQQLEIQYNFRWIPSAWLSLSSFVDLKIHNGDQIPFGEIVYEIGRARVGSIGAEIGLVPFRSGGINFGAKYNIGNISIEEKYFKATGLEFSINSKFLF